MTPPRDPPSGRILRGKALAEARAREQADAGKPPHRDLAGREITRPGPHIDPLDATEDDFPGPLTPVEHLRAEVEQVKAVVVDHGATLAERYEMPHAEAWQRLEDRIGKAEVRVTACEEARTAMQREAERRSRHAWLWRWLKGLGAGSVLAALVWAVTMIGDAGAAREAAARDKAAAREVFQDVRNLREQFAADHALLQLLVSRFAP